MFSVLSGSIGQELQEHLRDDDMQVSLASEYGQKRKENKHEFFWLSIQQISFEYSLKALAVSLFLKGLAPENLCCSSVVAYHCYVSDLHAE